MIARAFRKLSQAPPCQTAVVICWRASPILRISNDRRRAAILNARSEPKEKSDPSRGLSLKALLIRRRAYGARDPHCHLSQPLRAGLTSGAHTGACTAKAGRAEARPYISRDKSPDKSRGVSLDISARVALFPSGDQARREAEGARAASRQKSGRWKKAGSSERRRARRSGEAARRVMWPSLRPRRGDLP